MHEQLETARDLAFSLELAIRGALAGEVLDSGRLGAALERHAARLADLLAELCDAAKEGQSSAVVNDERRVGVV